MTEPFNATDVLEDAKQGVLTKSTIDEVISRLRQPDGTDPYTLIHILGYAPHTVDREELVSSYLLSSRDPMLARIALQVLCRYWGRTEDYVQYLREFLRGVEWDEDDDVRQVAISIAGEHLRGTRDPELSNMLLSIAADSYERPIIVSSAVSAIARALGRDWKDIPSPGQDISTVKEWTTRVIAQAKREM